MNDKSVSMSDASLIGRSIQALSDFSRLTGDQQNPVLLQCFSWRGRYLDVKKPSELTWWDRVSQKIYGWFFRVSHLIDQIHSLAPSEGERSTIAKARDLYESKTIRVLTTPLPTDVSVGSREPHTVLPEPHKAGPALPNEAAPLAKAAHSEAFTQSAVHQVQTVEGQVSSNHVMKENLKACRQYRPVVGRPSFLSEPHCRHRALALSCSSGGESYLVFLSENIASRQLAEGRQAAIVNAANSQAACGPRWSGITRALSDISDQALWTERTQQAKQEAGLKKDASLATGQCLSIEAPFSADLQVGWLFHALGPN